MQTTAEVRRPPAATSGNLGSNVHASSSAEPFANPDLRAKRHGKPKKPGYFHPRKPRRDEVIGGGFFVFRRGDAGRVNPGGWPYEHGTLEAAQAEADRLAGMTGGQFQVFGLMEGDDYAVGEVVAVEVADADVPDAEVAEGC